MSLFLSLALLLVIFGTVNSFSSGWTISKRISTISTTLNVGRAPSKVSDPSGPTVEAEPEELDTVNWEDIPEAHYDENKIPIPHQPWRRGETAGCEAPIDAQWRKDAEELIQLGVQLAGGTYIDTTWYLTSVVISIGLDFQDMKMDLFRDGGPEVLVETSSQAMWYDPDDPNPDPIWFEEDEVTPIFERDTDADQAIANRTYAKPDPDEGEDDSPESLGLDPDDDDVPLYVDKEYREDLALRAHELRKLRETKEDELVEFEDMFWMEKDGPEHSKYYGQKINTAALSTIGKSIYDALQEREEELQILSRHEVILASPSNPRSLDTQKKFDANIGKRVVVRTDDPWGSNRSLFGVLVDRNTLDVYINQKGRLVTIPNNFIAGVELALTEEEEEEYEAEYEALMATRGLSREEAEAEQQKQQLEKFRAEMDAELNNKFDAKDFEIDDLPELPEWDPIGDK